jgi:hypothetical protein
VEWDILPTTEWILDEINWRVAHDRVKDEMRGVHDHGCLDAERAKGRSRLYKLVMRLRKYIPEPTHERDAWSIGREERVDRPPPTTGEGLWKLAEKK